MLHLPTSDGPHIHAIHSWSTICRIEICGQLSKQNKESSQESLDKSATMLVWKTDGRVQLDGFIKEHSDHKQSGRKDPGPDWSVQSKGFQVILFPLPSKSHP